MKNEKKYTQTEIYRNEILKICARFYTELYRSTVQDRHPSQNNTDPDTSEPPPIMTSKTKKTLREIKNSKAPGLDNLTSYVIIPREEK